MTQKRQDALQTQARLLSWFINCVDDEIGAWGASQNIASVFNIGTRTIERHLSALLKIGLLQVIQGVGISPNRYTLALDREETIKRFEDYIHSRGRIIYVTTWRLSDDFTWFRDEEHRIGSILYIHVISRRAKTRSKKQVITFEPHEYHMAYIAIVGIQLLWIESLILNYEKKNAISGGTKIQ